MRSGDFQRKLVNRIAAVLDRVVPGYAHRSGGITIGSPPDYRREKSERFHKFTYDELILRDKISLDIFWLRDESLEDTDNLPAPEIIAAEIIEDLEAALAEFQAIADSLAATSQGPDTT